MDYEKKYKEALKRARKFYNELAACRTKQKVAAIFPELTESEDERIRKWLITQLENNYKGNYWATQAIAWLEKQKPVEYLSKQRVFAIMKKLTNLSQSNLIPLDSKEFDEINGITSDVRSLLDYPIEQKPAEPSDEELVRHPPITYTYPSDASRDEQLKMALLALLNSDLIKVAGKKFTKQDLIDWVEKKQEQKPVEGKEYASPDCGTSACCDDERFEIISQAKKDIIEKTNIAENELSMELPLLDGILMRVWQVGWLNKKPAEWSDEDEVMRANTLDSLRRYQLSMPNYQVELQMRWLKSLRPQPQKEIYQAARHDLAIKFMNYLDENRPEGKMSLSNGECEDIDKAFKENDWAKIMRYVEKYHSQPAEWTEEDKNAWKYLHELISWGYAEKFMDAQTAHDMRMWINEHLGPDTFQNGNSHWKPSEDEMESLAHAIQVLNSNPHPRSAKAYQDLQTLYKNIKYGN